MPSDQPYRTTPKAVDHFLRAVEQTVVDYRMIEPADRVLVAVSGGPDSMALLHVLKALSEKYRLKLAVAHLNHGLRPEAALMEVKRVESLAGQLGLPFFTGSEDVRHYRRRHRLSLEDAARRVRYAFLEQTAAQNGYNRIAVGHHADDNAELVLMYLIRGSGTLGLAGIPPVRKDVIIRPLIRMTRRQIISYLATVHQPYLTDQSNLDIALTRNRIRHDLLPRLEREYNPGIVRTLNRLADIMRTDQDWIESLIESAFYRSCLQAGPDRIELSIPRLAREHLAVRRRVLRKTICELKGDLRRIGFRHIQDAVNLLDSPAASASIDWPDRVRLHKRSATLVISRENASLRKLPADQPVGSQSYCYRIVRPIRKRTEIQVPEIGASFSFQPVDPGCVPDVRKTGLWVAFFDMDAVKYPITLRNFQPGDRFVPLGLAGSQKIKKFFIDHKVPRARRPGWPILLGAEEIIWVVGYRISDRVKLRTSTGAVLRVACDLPQL